MFTLTPTVNTQQTIERVRAMLSVITDAPSADEAWSGAFGMIIVSDDAEAIGITALPGPITDADAPWFVYVPFTNIGTSATFDIESSQVEIDSKARRIVNTSQVIVAVLENATSLGFSAMVAGRMLSRIRG